LNVDPHVLRNILGRFAPGFFPFFSPLCIRFFVEFEVLLDNHDWFKTSFFKFYCWTLTENTEMVGITFSSPFLYGSIGFPFVGSKSAFLWVPPLGCYRSPQRGFPPGVSDHDRRLTGLSFPDGPLCRTPLMTAVSGPFFPFLPKTLVPQWFFWFFLSPSPFLVRNRFIDFVFPRDSLLFSHISFLQIRPLPRFSVFNAVR